MASSHLVSSLVLLTFASSCLLFLQPHPSNANSLISCCFEKIYNFGDSISDTGNLIRQKPIGAAGACARLPYGETFFKHATGRCSNGRLMIDFIANASGLPFLNPYLEKDADFRHGVDFAVAGATALTGKDNDYNYAMFEGKGIQEVMVLVPKVVAAIMSGVREAIQELKREYPDAIVVYGDYSRAFQWVFDHAVQFGFDGESTRKACCGIGGDYNFNASRQCSPEIPVCSNPNKLISWDGIHLTEAVYKRMAEWLMNDMLPKLKCGV
ncbi:hypothetical protein RHGRI_011668 [Rhododendron griersonianum]|uniref:Uncharacterized protein n=1 Tax=Rhododendron griersonianum TaxID=479676 RepID=A0AAV6KN81_9ERIC|nr:hypothetical protein RHGRI_011668 [Rhododendron griersonianum]